MALDRSKQQRLTQDYAKVGRCRLQTDLAFCLFQEYITKFCVPSLEQITFQTVA